MHLSPREAHSQRLGPDAEAHPQRSAVHLYPGHPMDPDRPDPPNSPPEPHHICHRMELSHA